MGFLSYLVLCSLLCVVSALQPVASKDFGWPIINMSVHPEMKRALIVVPRCECIKPQTCFISHQKHIKSIEEKVKDSYCRFTEIRVTLKQGSEVCLNTNSNQGKALYRCLKRNPNNKKKRKRCLVKSSKQCRKTKKGKKGRGRPK
ncbi:uncharacterized protein WCC33_012317 [Rhinophrynus dorsalis]